MYDENLKIEIRPIPNRGDIKKFSENLEYFSQSNTIPCLVDPVTMKYATGLSKEDIEYLKKKNFPYDISDNWVRGEAHPFWESTLAKTELKNTPTFLYPGKNDLDFIKYKYLLQSSFIYSSEEEMLSGSKPEATHYIYNESKEDEAKATKLQKRNERIEKLSKLSLKRKRDLITLIEDEDVTNRDENYLTIKIEEITTDREKSQELDKLLSQEVEDVSMLAFVKMAVYSNVLKRTNKGIFYYETNLGFGDEEVKEFLKKDENQELYLNIKKRVEE